MFPRQVRRHRALRLGGLAPVLHARSGRSRHSATGLPGRARWRSTPGSSGRSSRPSGSRRYLDVASGRDRRHAAATRGRCRACPRLGGEHARASADAALDVPDGRPPARSARGVHVLAVPDRRLVVRNLHVEPVPRQRVELEARPGLAVHHVLDVPRRRGLRDLHSGVPQPRPRRRPCAPGGRPLLAGRIRAAAARRRRDGGPTGRDARAVDLLRTCLPEDRRRSGRCHDRADGRQSRAGDRHLHGRLRQSLVRDRRRTA